MVFLDCSILNPLLTNHYPHPVCPCDGRALGGSPQKLLHVTHGQWKFMNSEYTALTAERLRSMARNCQTSSNATMSLLPPCALRILPTVPVESAMVAQPNRERLSPTFRATRAGSMVTACCSGAAWGFFIILLIVIWNHAHCLTRSGESCLCCSVALRTVEQNLRMVLDKTTLLIFH